MSWDPDTAEGDLARFVDDLKTAFPAQAPASEDAHVAAMLQTAHLLADNGDPVVRPVSNADAPATQVSRLPKRRRSTMEKPAPHRLWLKVAAPIAAAFFVFGTMAAAGALPRGAQHVASSAAGLLGLDLPTGDDQGASTDNQDGDSQGEESAPVAVTDPTDQGDQNDQGDQTAATNEDDQGDNSQGDSTGTSGSDATSTDNQDGDSQGENDQGDTSSTPGTSDQGDQNDQGDGSTGTTSTKDGSGDGNSQGDGGSDASTSSSGDGNNQD